MKSKQKNRQLLHVDDYYLSAHFTKIVIFIHKLLVQVIVTANFNGK